MLSSLSIIDQSIVDSVWARGTEDDCRKFSKSALLFLSRAPDQLLRLRYLEKRGATAADLRKVARNLRKEAEKVGALRICAVAEEIESAKFVDGQLSDVLRRLDLEFAAAERRLAEISKALGQAIVEKTRTRKKSAREAP